VKLGKKTKKSCKNKTRRAEEVRSALGSALGELCDSSQRAKKKSRNNKIGENARKHTTDLDNI